MTTWAQRKRHEFIRERIDSGQPLNRADLVEHFTITKQTATATLHQFEALYPGVIAYDGRVKAFVRANLVGRCRPDPGRDARIAELENALRGMVWHWGHASARSYFPADYQPTCAVGAKDAASRALRGEPAARGIVRDMLAASVAEPDEDCAARDEWDDMRREERF